MHATKIKRIPQVLRLLTFPRHREARPVPGEIVVVLVVADCNHVWDARRSGLQLVEEVIPHARGSAGVRNVTGVQEQGVVAVFGEFVQRRHCGIPASIFHTILPQIRHCNHGHRKSAHTRWHRHSLGPAPTVVHVGHPRVQASDLHSVQQSLPPTVSVVAGSSSEHPGTGDYACGYLAIVQRRRERRSHVARLGPNRQMNLLHSCGRPSREGTGHDRRRGGARAGSVVVRAAVVVIVTLKIARASR
mmetsp:Transcript_67210/g.179197  ORF Transcript_67210/g.179197 Transcript_67210/m.179197 type:complete len:246 (-) Transcript_67210:86-823(-)